MSKLSLVAGRAALKLRKNGPTLMFAGGIATGVVTVVVACKATLQAQEVHKAHNQAIQRADAHLATNGNGYEAEHHKKQVVQIWTATSVAYAKLYGPAFILGVTSIALLTRSHQVLTTRNTTLMAAYAGLDKTFKQYRARVVEELGLEKDTEFAHGVETEVVTDYDEKGNAVVKETKKASPGASSLYGRWFDETNRHWMKDLGFNASFLDNQQKHANFLLKKNGHLFLNEVYDMLGMERTAIGQSCGWYYDNDEGDGYVDFGFGRYPEFVSGYQRSVFLDFNCDGPILNFIEGGIKKPRVRRPKNLAEAGITKPAGPNPPQGIK